MPGPAASDVTVVVTMPRARYSPQLGEALSELFRKRFAAGDAELELTLSDRRGAVARYALHAVSQGDNVALEELQHDVASLARSWRDDVERLLDRDEHGIVGLFPRNYRDRIAPVLAAAHARLVNTMLAEQKTLAIHVSLRADGLHVEGFHPDGPLVLSQFMPLLESVGLTVIEEVPDHLGGPHDLWAQDFLCTPAFGGLTPEPSTLAAAIHACWEGRCEVDSLNRLVTTAGMSWPAIAILRAYRRYRRQLGTVFTPATVNDAFVHNPLASLALVNVFRDRFDPDHADPDASAAALEEINDVESRDQDRILRDTHDLILATVRTNAFTRVDGIELWDQRAPVIALKIDGGLLADAPEPVPHREIFVNGPLVEGTHLRAGSKARGGLRWSDRHDDVRTEILQLMTAQVLKNALIVPTGAKGGFVVRQGTRDVTEDVEDRYRLFVHALLSVTDNLVDGTIVHPEGVHCWDDDDPYLVVAADRGTALLSDVANGIAADRGFWLGDAFASGGSTGYDHRALGITARGAWEIARLHFAEIGIDPEAEEISAVGVGDMSGDVFGNGMVRSATMRLLGAFDHRHVFIDPDPDPAAALAERRRLKELPGSSWDDWDRTVLSEGGMIVPRTAKTVELTGQVQKLLGTTDQTASPPQLIRALLGLNVDLLWFAGIGTWIRADDEPDEDIGDRANAEVRITVGDVRARVIVEGGNLALTRAARWQYAARGGRANLDAIDNAAGVAISDAEVNLKILLDRAVDDDVIDRNRRNELLRAWTDDVVDDVLGRVRRQAWSLGAEVARGAAVRVAIPLIRASCGDPVDRALPGIDEIDPSVGLSRPQVGVLGSIVRRHLADRMLTSPRVEPLLDGHRAGRMLPRRASEEFPEHVDEHPLRRQMAAASLANDLVNLLGPTAPWSLAMTLTPERRSGDPIAAETLDDVVLALTCAAESLDAHEQLVRLDEQRDLLGADRRREAERVLAATVTGLALVLLRDSIDPSTIDSDRAVLRQMRAVLDRGQVGTTARQGSRAARRQQLTDDLIDDDVAGLLAAGPDMSVAPVLMRLARNRPGLDVPRATDIVLRVSAALGLDRLESALGRCVESDDRWSRSQAHGLRADIEDVRHLAAAQVLDGHEDEDGLAAFLDDHRDQISAVGDLVIAADTMRPPRLDAVAVAVRAVRDALR